MSYLNENYRNFFIDLAPNNNSEWFNTNRKRYENDIKIPFTNLVTALITQLATLDKNLNGVKAFDCIFRINRDIRFSKDKTPYKLNMSAAIAPGGRKNMTYPGFYFEATPEGINIFGGVYMTEKVQLESIRYLIANNLKSFETLITESDFVKLFGGEILGEKQVRLAPELKVAAEKQPLIYNKQFYFKAELDESFIIKENLVAILCDYFKTARPVSEFLCKSLS